MAVREGLLALLSSGPQYGYQLKTGFEVATGGVWSLNVGQVYTTLDRLRRDGLVLVGLQEGDDGTEQKQYSLTAAGREALGEWWEAVPSEDPPPRDELQLKVLLAIEQGADHALDVITHQRTALTRLLQEHRRGIRGGRQNRARRSPRGRSVPAPADPDARAGQTTPRELASELVAEALTVRAEADLRWLDLCEARILRSRDRDGARGGE